MNNIKKIVLCKGGIICLDRNNIVISSTVKLQYFRLQKSFKSTEMKVFLAKLPDKAKVAIQRYYNNYSSISESVHTIESGCHFFKSGIAGKLKTLYGSYTLQTV